MAMVLDLWEKYKERDVALFIIRHADEACVLRLDQELAKVVGYQRVALRLGLTRIMSLIPLGYLLSSGSMRWLSSSAQSVGKRAKLL